MAGKRKRETNSNTSKSATTDAAVSKPTTNGDAKSSKVPKTNGHIDVKTTTPVIQIIAGSYERVLHGITASISSLSASDSNAAAQFTDTFLFNAHASAVRCLALSPLPEPGLSDAQGVYLATGGSDEKINVYSLAASPVSDNDRIPMPTLGNNTISENPRNRELGTLLQHSSNITSLYFPTRSKLLAGSEDNTISVTRLRDLEVVSTIKAPRPKVQGQPSGDTAPPGATPAGINDFAVHPSMKLMVSVGRGERCMRLWNLVTGKKAGVLNFSREILQSVKEGKYSSGEGRRIRWSPDGSEFAVSFERGAVVFGEDSKPRCKLLPQPLTKLHQICYFALADVAGEDVTLLAASTEDGRVLFYDTSKTTSTTNGEKSNDDAIPDAHCLVSIGGKSVGISSRLKDFEIILLPTARSAAKDVVVVAASSDGTIRLLHVAASDLIKATKSPKPVQLGKVIGTYATGSRITCMKAFLMQPPTDMKDDSGDEGDEFGGFDSSDEESTGESN
ncbi:Protein mak11 [Rhinocladiella similis]